MTFYYQVSLRRSHGALAHALCFVSHRSERRLSGIHEETVFKLRNGRLPLETREQDQTFQHAPEIRTPTSKGYGHSLIMRPITSFKYSPNGHDVPFISFSPDVIFIVLSSIHVCICTTHSSSEQPQHTRIFFSTFM